MTNHQEKNLRKKHDKKLNRLIQQQQYNQKSIGVSKMNKYDTSNVINKSKFKLTNEQLQILSKGLKFVPTSTSLNTTEIITNTEKSLFSASRILKDTAIAEISHFMTKWKMPQKRNISKNERELLKELKHNPNIIIVPADKGGKIVVMDRQEYIKKIEEQLTNTNTYEVVKDPTNQIKNKILKLTNKLFKSTKITDFQKLYFNSNENLPTIRGQPKIHKPEMPMRIITCTRSTITSNISQFVLKMIQQLRETISNYVKNTKELISSINKIKLQSDEYLASLDVKDLFTNIPINQSINIVIERIGQSESFYESALTKSDIRELLLVCLNNSYCTFNNKFFRQKRGLPMGNTLSPLLADLYMDQYIKNNMKKVNDKLFRYVDDLCIITKIKEEELKIYINELNSLKGTIKFTHEFEKNCQLNYLDTTLTRNIAEQRIDVKWYRKDTASDRVLHYESGHQTSIKVNIIKNMTEKIINTTKNNEQQKEDLKTISDMLIKSKYPRHLVDNIIKTCLKQANDNILSSTGASQSSENDKNKNDIKYTLTLPYVNGMEVLKRKLEKLNIKLYFSYPKKLNSLLTSTIKPQPKSIVYQIQCECGSIYNGETKVGLRNRSKQHNRIIEKDDNSTSSEMVQHHQQNRWQCMFNPELSFIIDIDTDYRKRRIKEAIDSIINDSINKHDSIDSAWNNILHRQKVKIKQEIEFKKKVNTLKYME